MTNTFLLLILHCIYVQIVGGWLLQSRCLLRSASASLPLSTRRCGGAITSPVVKDWKPHHKKSWSMYMIDKSHSEPPDEGEGGESEEGDANIAPKEKALTIVEASLRLDAVVSGGIGQSRTKMVKWMQEGKVVINGQVSKNISASVKEGMLIEIANIGRVHIDEIVTTSKGKYKISFRRVKFAAPRQDSSASHKSS